MKRQAFIFDLDGTLLNTIQDLANSVNETLRDFHQPTYSVDEVRMMVGNGVRKLIERACAEGTDSHQQEKMYQRFLEIYAREKAHFTKPYPGIVKTVQALEAQGMRCAVLSNKNDDAVKALCDQFFPDAFALSQGVSDHVRPKPAPDGLLNVCKRLGVDVEAALYIGDSEVDIQTGRAAKMDMASVTWGFREPETLLQAGATLLVDAPEELLKLV
ncbi:MAG: HAD-IA family hydrolase [Peptococcaceae bacterium]|nr:HAD-IA family hydrolase [Peptococcaceae bacterium]